VKKTAQNTNKKGTINKTRVKQIQTNDDDDYDDIIIIIT